MSSVQELQKTWIVPSDAKRGMWFPRHRNPFPIWDLEWFAWKEINENYVPYHVGTTPSGAHCPSMPRVAIVRPGVFRCPVCGKQFHTSLQTLVEKLEKQGGQDELLALLREHGSKYLAPSSK